jgi:hypothetical protein
LYSPKKNKANVIELYSKLYPATNSASASGKSNGVRFVSAKIVIKKIIRIGGSSPANHIMSSCILIISIKFKDPVHSAISTNVNPSDTSYEIIWEADRMEPNNEYRD